MLEFTQTYLSSLVEPYYSRPWSYTDVYNFSKTHIGSDSETEPAPRYLFGFGKTSPWQLDLLADPVQPFFTKQVEVFGYIKASAKPVILIAEEEKDSYPEAVLVDGEYYTPIEPTLQVIEDNFCHHIMFQGKLVHDKIKAVNTPDSYRSLAVYRAIEYLTADEELLENLFLGDGTTFINTRQAQGELLYMRHLDTPSYITPRLVEDIVVIVPLTKNV